MDQLHDRIVELEAENANLRLLTLDMIILRLIHLSCGPSRTCPTWLVTPAARRSSRALPVVVFQSRSDAGRDPWTHLAR
jgi:hypothetical protein